MDKLLYKINRLKRGNMFKLVLFCITFTFYSCSENPEQKTADPNQIIENKIDSVKSESESYLSGLSKRSYSNDPFDVYFNSAAGNNKDLIELISKANELISESEELNSKVNSFKSKKDDLVNSANYAISRISNKEIKGILERRVTVFSLKNKNLFTYPQNEMNVSDSLKNVIRDGITAIKILYVLNKVESDLNIYGDFGKALKSGNDSLFQINKKIKNEIKQINK